MIKKTSSYSGSVSGVNWKPAFDALWADLKGDGGTLEVDTQELKIQTMTALQPTNPVPLILKGDGSNRIILNASDSISPFYVSSLMGFDCRDLVFLGNHPSNTTTDADNGIFVLSSYLAKFYNCYFSAGFKTAAINAYQSQTLSVEKCDFSGSFVTEGGAIKASKSNQVHIKGCNFFDYMNVKDGFYSKSPHGVNAWVHISDPVSGLIGNGANNPYVHIEKCRFDEGATRAVYVDGYPLVEISRCATNVISVSNGSGFEIKNCKNVIIRQCNFGYATNPSLAGAAMRFENCEKVYIIGCTGDHAVTKIFHDADSNVKLIDCTGLVKVSV